VVRCGAVRSGADGTVDLDRRQEERHEIVHGAAPRSAPLATAAANTPTAAANPNQLRRHRGDAVLKEMR
jgi:hypothetical protein